MPSHNAPVPVSQSDNNNQLPATPTSPPAATPTPTLAPTPAPPFVPQLNSSYAGYVITVNGAQGGMILYIDAEDQQGNLSARVFYNVAGGQWRCTGKVGSNDIRKSWTK
jgi:hypothetical protein